MQFRGNAQFGKEKIGTCGSHIFWDFTTEKKNEIFGQAQNNGNTTTPDKSKYLEGNNKFPTIKAHNTPYEKSLLLALVTQSGRGLFLF